MRSNFLEVETFLHSTNPDRLALSESKLDSSVLSNDFSVPNYVVHRLDAGPCHGLILFAKSGLALTRLVALENRSFQFMVFSLCRTTSTHVFIFCYRSPNSDSDIFSALSSCIDEALHMYPSANLSVFGDFNVHHKGWLTHSRSTDQLGISAFNFSLCHDLTQIVASPTRIPDRECDGSYLLDLFLTSIPDDCSHAVNSPFGKSDHCVVSVSISSSVPQKVAPFHRTVLRYRDADLDGFRSFIADIPALSSVDPKELSEWISAGIEAFIPSKTYQLRPFSHPWFTPECAAAIAHRNHYFHRYQRSKSSSDLALFKKARNSCKKILFEAKDRHASHTSDLVASQRLGSKDFWKICNRILNKKKSSSTPLIDASGNVCASNESKARCLCEQFASNSGPQENSAGLPEFPSRCDDSLRLPFIKSKDVLKCILDLDSSKSCGPDKIPITVVRHCAPELSSILSKVYNLCLKTSVFPSCWKEAVVVPVPKRGDMTSPSNYRPISLLSVFGKIFEQLLNKQIFRHLNSHNLLSDFQFGFRRQRSSADLLAFLTEHISRILDKRGESRSVSLDISKAFDTVWHKGLLHKLSSYGIRESFSH